MLSFGGYLVKLKYKQVAQISRCQNNHTKKCDKNMAANFLQNYKQIRLYLQYVKPHYIFPNSLCITVPFLCFLFIVGKWQ